MESSELSLFVECHEFVCTIETRSVERLVLSHDVVVVTRDGAVPVVQVAARNYASFNLGRLLGMPPTIGASVLVNTVVDGAPLALCFDTGPCLVVRAPPVTVKLQSGLFNARRRAIVAAFEVPAAMRSRARSPVGLTLAVEELITAAEREAAASSLRAVARLVASAP